MSQTNFLIGRGELLTSDIRLKRGAGPKPEPYSLSQAIGRLTPQFEAASSEFDKLPPEACPRDFAIAKLTMNPSFIAKSYFPEAMLRDYNLRSVGSRPVKIRPEKWTKKAPVEDAQSIQIFVAGHRSQFRRFREWASELTEKTRPALDVAHIEQFSAFLPSERIIAGTKRTRQFFEVGIHLLPGEDSSFIKSSFADYSASLGIKVHDEFNISAGNLWFVPIECTEKDVGYISQFSFVRVIRPMPVLRGLQPMQRSAGIPIPFQLPAEQPVSSDIKVAILDGGLPQKHHLSRWLKSYRKLDERAQDDPNGLAHGLAVTSAFLFGPIDPNSTAKRPFSDVTHLRVLDRSTKSEDPLELYRTLALIEEVLLSRQYQFINLSLGPDLCVEDHEVHSWTSVIDQLLSDGDTLMTVAVGNNGHFDRESGNARIQVPADCVNALSVGACDSISVAWKRSPYSAIGPGRHPGVIKPDLVAFGGDTQEYFHVLTNGSTPSLAPERGTSFAAPYLLRSAVGIRSILGQELSPLAIKALLIHAASPSRYEKIEVGWGKIPEDVFEVITCPPGVARIVYQGDLKPGKYLRAPIPLPSAGLKGKIELKATFCYASQTDPHDAPAYTRAGLDVWFRPNKNNIKVGKSESQTRGFFEKKAYATEDELRLDSGKWETVLHGQKNMYATSLDNPAFDIHYNARESAGPTSSAERIRYALIITVSAPKNPTIYNDILRAYAKQLIPIQPQVTIPLRT